MITPAEIDGAVQDLPPQADRLPTLTEVLQLAAPVPEPVDPAPVAGPGPGQAARAPDAEVLVAQVLASLAPRIDALVEARLREALAPALARAADGLIREARDELARVLLEVVGEAVARTTRPGVGAGLGP